MLVRQNITKTVKAIIDNDLAFQDALQRGYGNFSAMARMIKPSVDAILNRDVSIESIVTALKRIRHNYTLPSKSIESIIADSKINVRTDVAKISIAKSRSTIEKVSLPLKEHYDSFISVSEGINSVTMIFDDIILERMKDIFNEYLLEVEDDLAAIIVQSPEEIIKTPGCALVFYNQLARRRINIEDTVSCYTDTIIIVKMDDVARAFNALTDLISESRKQIAGISRGYNF
jgi:aspartokinase